MSAKRKVTICELIHWALVRENVAHVVRLQENAFATDLHRLGYATSATLLELGTHIDSSTQAEKVAGAVCHDDAVLVWEAISMLHLDGKLLVVKHGRSDTSPYFAPEGVGKEVPVRDVGGNLKKLYEIQQNQRVFVGYKSEWKGLTRAQVIFHRKEYRLWREAIVLLHAHLKNQLVGHELKKKIPSATPWKLKVKRILKAS